VERAMYFVALDGVTRYALNEAVKAIIRGALGHTFFPSPVELRKQCDAAMAPHIRQAERVRRHEALANENAEFERVIASRTPESITRVEAVYDQFCKQYRSPAAETAPMLDPELVAQVPDAATFFKKAKTA
jgi:hypothetical protein